MKRKTLKEVREIFFKNGLIIDEGETYKGNNKKMLCYTKDGYKVMARYDSVKNGNMPEIFSKNNPYTIDNIKLWLEKNDPDYELLSNEFKGSKEKLLWKKKNSDLPPFEVSWGNFYFHGHRSPHLHYQKIAIAERLDIEEVRKQYDQFLKNTEWYLPNGEELNYKNSKSKLTIYDKEGYISKISLNGLKKGRKPVRFHKNLKETSTYNMKKYLKENTNYTFKEGQKYNGNNEEYVFICPIHGEFKTKWVIIQNGHKCMECYLDDNRGENNPNWNPNLTEEDRLYLRLIDGYNEWRKSVYKRDGYTCQSCGIRGGGNLVAHHLDAYSWCEEKRTDINNGITLCELCHTAFHNTYGYKNNTKEQYQEWIKTREDIETIKKKTVIKKKTQKELPIKKSGIIGIHWEKRMQKWRVRIRKNGQLINGGFFENIEEAIKRKEVLLKDENTNS